MTTKRFFQIRFVGFLLFFALCVAPVLAQTETDYWPVDSWRTSTPEEQGIDSERLVAMLNTIRVDDDRIDSITVIRHGYMVLDIYIAPYQPDMRHIIHSCSKSITSTLVGIAIDQGYIDGVNVPLLELFSDWTPQNGDSQKEAITLEDVLMMGSGLDCQDSYLYSWRGLSEMRRSPDWVQHMLDLPMAHEPGTYFEYCNGGTFLLAAAIQEATGQPTLDFAEQNLFGPLGITDYTWDAAPENRVIGWGGLRMLPHDMAKIGYLFLHNGVWNGQQIVSADWVKAATTPHIHAGTLGDDYGYQWWINEGFYVANGYAGQHIFVAPNQDLVVVFTSSLSTNEYFTPTNLFRQYILPAVVSDEPLPENPEAQAQLAEQVSALSSPEASAVPSLPEFAAVISGQTYALEDNVFEADTASLVFEAGAPESQLILTDGDEKETLSIGMDGLFRVSPLAGEPNAFRGAFTNNAFVVEWRDVYWPTDGTINFQFRDDSLAVVIRDPVGDFYQRVLGELVQ